MSNHNGNRHGSFEVAFWLLLAVILMAVFAHILRLNEVTRAHLSPAIILATIFAFSAFLLRGVNSSGAVAGWLLTVVIYSSGGISAFGTLVIVFALTWTATRMGRSRKLLLGVAEPRRGRDGAQVLANLWTAALVMALGRMSPQSELFRIAALAALAEAASDTVSSEIGQAFAGRVWLITTGRGVPVGSDGGVSATGFLAGCMAATAVAVETALTHQVKLSQCYWIALCGFLGTIFDSILGASFERKGQITNNLVNFFSTSFSAGLALLIQVWTR